jgi:mRNA interferase MazF
MAGILRGDIYWADLDPTIGHEQAGRRPVLILSRPAFNDHSGTVVAVALTSAEPRAGYPLTLELTKTSLPKRTWVKISQIRTLSTQRLAGRLASCHPTELQGVIEGLNELVGKP